MMHVCMTISLHHLLTKYWTMWEVRRLILSQMTLGYHQIRIALEDRHKTNFLLERGSFQYTVMPFGLKNEPAIYFRVVVTTFKDYINKLLEVQFDDWTIFGLLQKHIVSGISSLGPTTS